MLRIAKWEKWQKGGLEEIRRKRKLRGTDPRRPYLMPFFAGSAQLLGEDFQKFAGLVGGRQAETFLWRCLGYACQHNPLHGCRGPAPDGALKSSTARARDASADASVDASRDASRARLGGGLLVSRAAFGQLVLSRTHDRVSRRVGEIVYDALVTSTMCVRVNPETLYDLPPTEEIPIGRSVPSRTRPGRRTSSVRDTAETSRAESESEMDDPSSPTYTEGEGGTDLPDHCGRCQDGFRQELNSGKGGCCTDCRMGRRRAAKFSPGFERERAEERAKQQREEDHRGLEEEDELPKGGDPKRLRDVLPRKFRQAEEDS